MWQMVMFVPKLINRHLSSLHREIHGEKTLEVQKDWSAVLLDTGAEGHFLVLLSTGHLAVQPNCIEEDGIIPHGHFQHAMKISDSQLTNH